MPLQGSTIKPKILSAAISLFGTWGYKGVTYTAIANEAVCMPAGIFRLFKNKRNLYIEALGTVLDGIQQSMASFAISLVTGTSERDRTASCTRAVNSWYKSLSREGARFMLQVMFSDSKRRPEVDAGLDLLAKILVQTADAKGDGDVKLANARDLVHQLFFLKCTHSGTPDSEQREVDRHLKKWLESNK